MEYVSNEPKLKLTNKTGSFLFFKVDVSNNVASSTQITQIKADTDHNNIGSSTIDGVNYDIEIPKNNCVTVPEKAVVRQGNIEGIFIENDVNTFAFVAIKTGIRHAGEVEITATISGNDIRDKRIVMQGAYSLLGIMTNSGGE